jgi:hypothetical protein
MPRSLLELETTMLVLPVSSFAILSWFINCDFW